MDVEAIRAQIPVCQRLTYLNTGWQGPSPRGVVEAVMECMEYESFDGPTTREVFAAGRLHMVKAKEQAARLINATPDEIVLTSSTTEGLNIVLNGLDWNEGDEIIVCSLEHMSVMVPSLMLNHRFGVQVKVLQFAPAEEHDSILRQIEAAITPKTRMVFFSHIQYSTGLRMPAEGIRKLTKDRGILMLVDSAQGAGHIALDMRQLDPDFYSFSGQKWLLGPSGTGGLFVRRDLVPQLRPVRVSSRSTSFHDHLGNYEAELDSIEKFPTTNPSHPLWAGFVDAVQFNLDAGTVEIEERILSLSDASKRQLGDIPGVQVTSPTEGPGRSGLVTFTVEGAEPPGVVDRMWDEHGIVCRQVSYPPAVRLSFSFFNTEEEVAKSTAAIGEIAASS